MELFHGTQNVELQVISGINIVQNMSDMICSLREKELICFAEKMRHKCSLRNVVIGTNSASYPIGAGNDVTLTDDQFSQVIQESGFKPTKLFSYKRISLRGITIHSIGYTRVRVRNTYTVKYYDHLHKQF